MLRLSTEAFLTVFGDSTTKRHNGVCTISFQPVVLPVPLVRTKDTNGVLLSHRLNTEKRPVKLKYYVSLIDSSRWVMSALLMCWDGGLRKPEHNDNM